MDKPDLLFRIVECNSISWHNQYSISRFPNQVNPDFCPLPPAVAGIACIQFIEMKPARLSPNFPCRRTGQGGGPCLDLPSCLTTEVAYCWVDRVVNTAGKIFYPNGQWMGSEWAWSRGPRPDGNDAKASFFQHNPRVLSRIRKIITLGL